MGCSYSRSNGDGNPNLFNVYNVDDQGQELTSGKIEVSETELVLYQKNKEPIRWPLRCLRRYGFDAELFSFESGRRCPTGSGIYAFKCRRAEALFNLLQDCIHRAGQEEQRYNTSNTLPSTTGSRTDSLPDTTYVSPNVPAVPILTEYNTTEVPSDDAGHSYINGDIAQVTAISTQNVIGAGAVTHEYVNSAICSLPRRKSSTDTETVDFGNIDVELDDNDEVLLDAIGENGSISGINYTMIDLPQGSMRQRKQSEDSRHSCDENRQAEAYMNIEMFSIDVPKQEASYMNMDIALGTVNINGCSSNKRKDSSSGQLLRRTLQRQASLEQHSYANLELNGNAAHKARNSLPNCSKVNYIQLDLEQHADASNACGMNSSPVSPVSICSPESPNRKTANTDSTESYAMIDFDKTVALSNTTKARRLAQNTTQ